MFEKLSFIEERFAELEAKLSILEKNIDKYLISADEIEEKCDISNKKVLLCTDTMSNY